jgi:predicted nucleic acid-binding protein
MRFWDSSAVVPLLIDQAASARAARWATEDSVLALWTLTPAEVASAFRRLVREGALPEDVARQAEARMDELALASHVIVDVEAVKSLALRALRLHPLRAFDALQLGAALHWAEGRPDGRAFLTLDARLAEAAQREGFALPP